VVGEILAAVEEAQLDGEISTRDDAISLIVKRFQGNGQKLKKSNA
jgi:hypothetical protein